MISGRSTLFVKHRSLKVCDSSAGALLSGSDLSVPEAEELEEVAEVKIDDEQIVDRVPR